jgi:hypothetical protein
MATFRVLVTGSRSWAAADTINKALDDLLAEHGTLIVVHGAARDGADRYAQSWALSRRHASSFGAVTPEPHPANWAANGTKAGFIRNAYMVSLGANLCLGFIMPCTLVRCAGKRPHGTHGATHCAGLAVKASIEIRRFDG